MESSSSSSSSSSYWEYIIVLLLRPIIAITFSLCFICIWWFLAWKLVLAHVPLVQDIFGLKKKTFQLKPSNPGRLSKFYRWLDTQHSNPE